MASGMKKQKKKQNFFNNSPNNFFNPLKKNHSISNIATPLNNTIKKPNTMKLYTKMNERMFPFRRSSLNNKSNHSLNTLPSSKDQESKSKKKSNGNDEKLERQRLLGLINGCKISQENLLSVLTEISKSHPSLNLELFQLLSKKIQITFEAKSKETKLLEKKVIEKDEIIQKLEKEKNEIFLQKSKKYDPNEGGKPEKLAKENMELKNKIIDQQNKIMDLKENEKKIFNFMNDLKIKGVDLEDLLEKKLNKKKKKNNEEIAQMMVGGGLDFSEDGKTYQADESIFNDSDESSFNYYGKPIDLSQFKDINENFPIKSVAKNSNNNNKNKKIAMKLNLKAINIRAQMQMEGKQTNSQ